MAPSVIVLGASGNVGPFVISELLVQKSHFNRIAILSDPTKVEKFANARSKGVEIVAGSFLDASSFKGFDVVISLLGGPVFAQQPAIIDAAVSAGVSHFYPSEIGLDISLPLFETQAYFGDKLLTRKHLAEVTAENPHFGYTLLAIGMVTEFVAITPLFGVDKEKRTVDFIGTEDGKLTLTSFPDIARYLTLSILTAMPGPRTLRVQGETFTAGQLFTTLSRVQNIPYQVSYAPPSTALQMQEKFKSEGKDYLAGIMNLRYVIGERGWLDEDKDDSGLFDFQAEKVEETLERMAV